MSKKGCPLRKNFFLHLSGMMAVLSLPLLVSACRERDQPANFILITLDTQRADHISAYDPACASTPHIDELARKGILYENAYSLIPITLPSHASLFFSERPFQIKNYNNGQAMNVGRSIPSLASVFQKRGFLTAAFVSLGVLESRFGLDQGFDEYEDRFPPDRWYLTAGEVNEKVFRWLEKNSARRFFLWVHYSDPHDPYAPPDMPDDFKLFLNNIPVLETCLQKYARNEVSLDILPGKNELRFELRNEFNINPDLYLGRLDKLEFDPPAGRGQLQADFSSGWFIRKDGIFFFKNKSLIILDNPLSLKEVKLTFQGKPIIPVEGSRKYYQKEVEYMDGEIGRLWQKLSELRLFEESAILLVGDHGEGLGDNLTELGDPYIGHIHYLHDVYMKVPLILKAPSLSGQGLARKETVTLLDVAPTIFGVMGFKPLSRFQGRNLLRLSKDEMALIFSETYRPEATRDRFGLLSFPWHFILTPEEKKYELFNLLEDPGEKINIYKQEALGQELGALKQKLEGFARRALSEKGEVRVDDKAKEMLKALGYIR